MLDSKGRAYVLIQVLYSSPALLMMLWWKAYFSTRIYFCDSEELYALLRYDFVFLTLNYFLCGPKAILGNFQAFMGI